MNPKTLPIQRADQLSPVPAQIPWLIQELWTDQAVGILGGEPKCCKSFLALDIALSVASGSACLRRYPVRHSGPVLVFPAEDSLAIVRQRLDGLAAAAALTLRHLPLHVITAPSLRLDLATDRQRLTHTLETLQPVLLILDPLIRLHQLDENDASQIARLLGFLRQLQRQFHLAVLVVHHAKKDGASLRPGQALRGSSELHGWGDSNLYLRRHRDQLSLTVEHRAAPSLEPIALALKKNGTALALALLEPKPQASAAGLQILSPQQRILQALARAGQPICLQPLRKLCGLRTATLCQLLKSLCAEGTVRHQSAGYSLADPPGSALRPASSAPPLILQPSPEPLSQTMVPIEAAGNGNGKQSDLSSETEAGSAEEQPAEG
jgi:hypothetical protein